MLRLDGGPDTLIFLPGFMTAPGAYRQLLEPVAAAGLTVLVPQLYPRGVRALLGGYSVVDEAAAAARLVGEQSGRVLLAGHSRGGQAAWRAAGLVAVAGLCLVDPVDGQGRAPQAPTATAEPARFNCPTLIIGAGHGGKCAPAAVNFEHFAEATPFADVVVVEAMGHADMLSGRARDLGRRLCGGGPDPDAYRGECSQRMIDFLTQ